MGTKIYNSELTRELRDGARIQTSTDATPSEIADKVVPVMEVNPRLLRVCNILKGAVSTGANVTIYTTPADRDFYLTYAQISMAKIVTDTNSTSSIKVFAKGQTTAHEVVYLAGITLTAERGEIASCLEFPLLLERNSIITISKVAANGTSAGVIAGYTVDNPNA